LCRGCGKFSPLRPILIVAYPLPRARLYLGASKTEAKQGGFGASAAWRETPKNTTSWAGVVMTCPQQTLKTQIYLVDFGN
jgi:hypothetical protein